MINRKFKKCLITGITGSGGSYLAEHILLKDKNNWKGMETIRQLYFDRKMNILQKLV